LPDYSPLGVTTARRQVAIVPYHACIVSKDGKGLYHPHLISPLRSPRALARAAALVVAVSLIGGAGPIAIFARPIAARASRLETLPAHSLVAPRQRSFAATASLIPTIGTVHCSFFPNPDNSSYFTITPTTPPVFTQDFPIINFNPPADANYPCSNATGVTDNTRPFADVSPNPDGTCSVIVTQARSGGPAAGVGDLYNFHAVYTSTLTVASAGPVVFGILADDGWIMSIGPGPGGAQPARVDGSADSLYNAPPAGPFTGYPVVGAYNYGEAPDRRTITVNFPAAGTYPFEMDYTESNGNQLALTLETSVPPPPTATPTDTPTNTPAPTATNTPVPLALPANTAAPLANTPVPPANTAVPPANTSVPPDNTAMPVPPVATAAPSSATLARASATAMARASATAMARARTVARARATTAARRAAVRKTGRLSGSPRRAGVAPPLTIVVSPRSVYSDGMVTVRAHTVPGARLRIRMQVTTSRLIFITRKKHRIGTERTVVLYGIQRDVRANGHGQVTALLKIAYQPAAPVRGNLAVTATQAHGAATRVARLRIQALPLAVGVTPRTVRFDHVVVVNARTLPYAFITADLRALSTRTTSTGTGKRRTTVVHMTVVFRTTLHGRADKRGRFVGRLRVTRELDRTLPGSLMVTASTRQGSATNDTRMTIRP